MARREPCSLPCLPLLYGHPSMTAVGSEDGRKLEKQSGFPINFSLSHLLADGFIIGGLPFLGWARRKRSEHLPESLRADSPTWLSSPHSIPERAFLNGGSQPWSLRDADGKTFWHTTFRISRIVQVRREDYGKLSAYGQSLQECVGMYRQMMNICPSLQTYTCFMGLPSTLFSIHLNECSLSFFLVKALYSTHSTQLQSDPWTFAGISVRPLDTFPWQR